ncbi:MAG: tyrosine-type recombinase/integrase [Candidatus Pacearchaeota archaeon]|jgi:integrase
MLNKKRSLSLSEEEFIKILEVSKKHYKFAYFMVWYSGCRISEILNLEPGDVNLKNRTMLIKRGKNSEKIILPLPMHFRAEMFEIMPLKKLLNASSLQAAFKLDCGRAGILVEKPYISLNALRRSFLCNIKKVDI